MKLFPCFRVRRSSATRPWSRLPAGIGLISLSVWAHHMFTVGMTSASNAFFVLSTGLVGVPTGIKIFQLAGYHVGRQNTLRHAYALLHRLPCCSFCLPGLTGIMLSIAPWNWQLHNSYFVVAHFPLRAGGRDRLLLSRRLLLLVPQDDRQDARRAAGQVAVSGSVRAWLST